MSAKLSRLLACESEPSDAEDEVDVDADDDEDVDEDEDAGVVVDAVELVGAEDRAADEDDEEEEARLVDVVEGVQAGEDQVLVAEGLGVQAGVLEVEVFLPLLSSSSGSSNMEGSASLVSCCGSWISVVDSESGCAGASEWFA